MYQAIVIDTSIFDGNGLRLETGVLADLEQFKSNSIHLVIPDVVLNEIKCHLVTKIEKNCREIENSLKSARTNLGGFCAGLDATLKTIKSYDHIEIAESRLNGFINKTGAVVLKCGEYLSVDCLLDNYFKGAPPFLVSSKKKNEFPDAIALLAVKAWSEKNSFTVLAVSSDKDWSGFCEKSSNMTCIDDLTRALESINESIETNGFLTELVNFIHSGNSAYFLGSVFEELDSYLSTLDTEVKADYIYNWIAHVNIACNKLNLGNKVSLIAVTNEFISIKIDCRLSVIANAYFEYYHDDYTLSSFISGGDEEVEVELSSELVLKISGFLDSKIDELHVDEVVLVSPPEFIDFGKLNPDHGWDW